jgi:soluble lytic murein transglycosylase-like protein
MQYDYQINPLRYFLARYQSALVVVMGFASAFLLGLLLWNLTSAAQVGIPVMNVGAALDGISNQALNNDGVFGNEEAIVNPSAKTLPAGTSLSPLFTPEVQHWHTQILHWANLHGLDPNLVATVMQIESCGNPQAISRAGARGLFQVMPFHFDVGEDTLDPDTNAARGMAYLAQALEKADDDVALALAAYNGGHGIIDKSWESWPAETQRYYRWGGGIYADVSSGLIESSTLQEWLAAGGTSLCVQAAAQLGLQP